MDKYEIIDEDLGAGSFGIAKLCRNKQTKELVAIKFIERGPEIDEYVAREIMNHRSLQHPNIIRFIEVVLTPSHMGLVLEYASGGELFERLSYSEGPFSEDEARYFFQQLITGISYCHSMEICHRDLKLDNILLNGTGATPCLKICDFGYSKSSLFHPKPKTFVGSPSYAAPELRAKRHYDGKLADVWSCGVNLYVMLVGKYPFEDPEDSDQPRISIPKRIIKDFKYKIPDNVHLSEDCHHLLSRIFVQNPSKRISINEIKSHPWFLKNLQEELRESNQATYCQRDRTSSFSVQSVEEIMKIMEEAKKIEYGEDDEEDEEKLAKAEEDFYQLLKEFEEKTRKWENEEEDGEEDESGFEKEEVIEEADDDEHYEEQEEEVEEIEIDACQKEDDFSIMMRKFMESEE